MAKYIDAERLRAEIESIKLFPQISADYNDGREDMKMAVFDIIDSLQQEQSEVDEQEYGPYARQYPKSKVSQERPNVDLVAELEHHLATTPKEQLEKEWKELEPWGNIGPTVQEFLYGKQPEVDIKKEIEEHAVYMPHGEFASDNEIIEDMEWARKEFRYFFELGLNTRK